MPAPSTLRMQNLRKLATSSMEAREMLKFLNDMQKLKVNQKNFYSSSPHSSSNNSLDNNTSDKNIQNLSNIELYTSNKQNTSSYDFNLFIFNNLLNIIGNNPINKDTQLIIERFLNEQFKDFISNKKTPLILGVDTDKFSSGFNKYCFNKVEEIKVYL